MYPLYRDLREKLGPPLWHDAEGVPRYSLFGPRLLGIYDKWAVLFLVECQACSMRFPCAVGIDIGRLTMPQLFGRNEAAMEFADLDDPMTVLPRLLGWGDAPWHTFDGDQASFDDQCSGTTMTTGIVRILEVWHRQNMEWVKIELTNEQANQLLEGLD